ncbi:four helix bundle protein [Scytonema sp. NUACC26]|uniref:four helix bundle protein n=1 Tax=Scytonema sp. NUACC26 TaxID=3140176 RepID=UPI0038B249F3
MSIAYKECLETKYWLYLLKDTRYITPKAFDSLYKDAEEISTMLWSILKTSKPDDHWSLVTGHWSLVTDYSTHLLHLQQLYRLFSRLALLLVSFRK